jgi:hypothetical protein
MEVMATYAITQILIFAAAAIDGRGQSTKFTHEQPVIKRETLTSVIE